MKDNYTRVIIMGNDIDRLGGIGRFMNELSLGFNERGYETHLVGVTPTKPSEHLTIVRPPEIKEHVLWPSLAPENWSLRSRADRLNPARLARFRRRNELKAVAVQNLRDLLKTWGPETVIICTQVFGMEHLKEAGFNHHNPKMPRVIGQYHGSFDMCVETSDLRRVIRGYSEVDRFVALTQRDADLFRKSQLHNATWMPNPVSGSELDYSHERKNTIVSLGRYNEQKSLEYLIDAWGSISNDFPEWNLELYGEGDKRYFLQDRIDRQKIERINLMGLANDIGSILNQSKIHAMSSQYEGLPIAIIEASMAGVPTVSFDCAPGISDLIEHGESGLIVPKNSTSGLAGSLAKLMSDSSLLQRMSVQGVAKAAEYSRDSIMDRWLLLLDDMAR